MKAMRTTSLRFGHVTEYDPSRHTARVNFPDIGLTSWWLPVLVSNSLKNHDEVHLDVGEHVACLMAGEMGVILGAFYDDKNPPAVKDSDVRAVTFSDGVRVSYDRKAHELSIASPEAITLNAGNITLNTGNITLKAENTTITGSTTLSGSITLAGSVSCPGYCHCGG